MKSRRPKRFCLTVWTEQNYGYQFSSKLRPMLHSNISNEIDCPSLRLSNRGLRNMCEERDKIPRFTRISLSKLWSKRYSCESRDFIPFLAHGSQTAIRQSQRWTIDFVWFIGMQHWTQFCKDELWVYYPKAETRYKVQVRKGDNAANVTDAIKKEAE